MQPANRRPVKAPEPPRSAVKASQPPKPASSKIISQRPSSAIKKPTEVLPANRSLEKKGSMGGSKPTAVSSVSRIQPKMPVRNSKMAALQKKEMLEKEWKLDWTTLPMGVYPQFFEFACRTVWDVFKLTHVCRSWRYVVESEEFNTVWEGLKVKTKVKSIKQLASLAQEFRIAGLIKSYGQYEKIYVRLFDYGSTKENIANKLLAKLNLQIHLKINKVCLTNIPYKMRNFNFSSYLVFKCTDIGNIKFDFSTPHNMFKEKINLELVFQSKKYKASHVIKKQYFPEEIYQTAIRQKAFNYFIDKNLVFTLFEGDDHFIYLLGEFSAIELVTEFRKEVKRQTVIRQLQLAKQKKKLCQDFEYQSFSQYFRYQADFELHFSFHNSEKQMFTHVDTKVFPVEYNQKQAMFILQINDSFPIQKTFRLDNKMGISEPVQNLYLLDLVLKDRDRFLITFSGFIYAKQLSEQQKSKLDNYMRITDMPIYELAFKNQRYSFEIVVIQEKNRYFMPSMHLMLYPEKPPGGKK